MDSADGQSVERTGSAMTLKLAFTLAQCGSVTEMRAVLYPPLDGVYLGLFPIQ